MRPGHLAASLVGLAVAVAACGSGGGSLDAGQGTEAGYCGTHNDPGILALTGLTPALGAKVSNHAIVHGFSVPNAPAVFTNFSLRIGAAHTAGVPTPASPTLQAVLQGNTVIYQLTIDSWSRAPGHVELEASNGYDTSKGCSWEFPTPLFSYDVSGGVDGGAGAEAGSADGGLGAHDAALDAPTSSDAPSLLDVPTREARGGVDSGAPLDQAGGLDAPAASVDLSVDGAPIDAGAADVPVSTG